MLQQQELMLLVLMTILRYINILGVDFLMRILHIYIVDQALFQKSLTMQKWALGDL